jgi:hypothetical protein
MLEVARVYYSTVGFLEAAASHEHQLFANGGYFNDTAAWLIRKLVSSCSP